MLPSYLPGEASAYARSQGWKFKTSGVELILKCVFCGKNDKLYWNDENGAYDCKSAVCGKSGNYFTLRRDLGDPVANKPITALELAAPKPKKRKTFAEYAPFEANMASSPEGRAYLKSRGISDESILKWHIGFKTDAVGKHKVEGWDKDVSWIMIPYITLQGDIADVKYRTLPPAPKDFKRLGGGDSILFGEHLLPETKGKKKTKVDTLYLCEGELDAITLDQHGFSPALSTTCGAKAFSPRWYDLIVSSGAKKIVVIYDSDVDGQETAKKLAKKFNDEDRTVTNVILEDAKDANEYFLTHTAEDFKALIANARPEELEYCLSASAVLDRISEQLFMSGGQLNGIPSAFPNLNELIDGGYWNGSLTTVVGTSGTGKTSLVLQDGINMGTNGLPFYMCCLEMPEVMMMRKVINHLYHVPIKDIKQHHIDQYRADIERRNLYFGSGVRNLDKLQEVFVKAHKRYDLKCICFDNINFLCRDGNNTANDLGQVTKRLKELAVELNIPIIAIAQPGKFDRAQRIITENDVKGCLPPYAKVQLSDGSVVTMAELYANQSGRVATFDSRWRAVSNDITSVWESGQKEILRIKLRTGRQIDCSVEHKLLVEGEWTMAGMVAAGDKIAIPRKIETSGLATMTVPQSTLLGWLAGDGNYTPKTTPSISTPTEDIELLQAISKEAFGLDAVARPDSKSDKVRNIVLRSEARPVKKSKSKPVNALTNWLRRMGIYGQSGRHKTIPIEIYRQPNDVIAGYLRGLFHADGSLTVTPERTGVVSLSSISPHLAYGAQSLLLRFGIVASVVANGIQPTGFCASPNASYTLRIQTAEFVKLYMRRIGFLGEKHARANAKLLYVDWSARKAEILPSTITDMVLGMKSDRGLSWAEIGCRVQHDTISRDTCLKIANKTDNMKLLSWATSDIYWDVVVSIESLGAMPTYDMEVADTHNFIVDGVITHNSSSIEQDSDNMILLWRPTVRTEIESFGTNMGQKENQSPLTLVRVGKARYSPGGETLLYFHGELGTFRQISKEESEQLLSQVAKKEEQQQTTRGRRNG